MRTFNVFLPTNTMRYNLVDTVYFNDQCDADYVKNSLIDHDNYSCYIIVEEAK
jgi:hypothetical protein